MRKLIPVAKVLKKHAICASTSCFAAFAIFFASAACLGRFYEPEVPKKLQ